MRAAELLSSGWPLREDGDDALARFDDYLREGGRRINPGTTADLVCAALYVALRDGTIELPRVSGPVGWSIGRAN